MNRSQFFSCLICCGQWTLFVYFLSHKVKWRNAINLKENKNSLNVNDQKGELTSLWEGEESLYNVEHEDYHINTQRLAASKRIVDVMSVEMTHVPGIGIDIIFLRPIMAAWSLFLNPG